MYKIRICIEVDSNNWNSDLKKSNYSTYLQTVENLKINSNENTFPVFISILDEKDAVVGVHYFKSYLKWLLEFQLEVFGFMDQ